MNEMNEAPGPQTVTLSDWFAATRSFEVGKDIEVARETLVRTIHIAPARGYVPPTPSDRWGWRADLRRNLGGLWASGTLCDAPVGTRTVRELHEAVSKESQRRYLAAVLDLMDDAHLLEQAHEQLNPAVWGLLDFVVETLDAKRKRASDRPGEAVDARDVQVFGAAVANVTREMRALIDTRSRAALTRPLLLKPGKMFRLYRTAQPDPLLGGGDEEIEAEGLVVLANCLEKYELGKVVL